VGGVTLDVAAAAAGLAGSGLVGSVPGSFMVSLHADDASAVVAS
jgi:hypothetical protein